MHLFNTATLFVVLTLLGVEFSISAFMNPAAWRLEPEAQLKMLSHSALVLGKVMPVWYLVSNLALRLGVPVKGGGLKDGIEVFPRQDRIEDGELGNAIRGPIGVHRKTNRRYWFYEAEPNPEAQLAYIGRLRKLTETELRTFIEGMSLPEAYRPVTPAPYNPPVSSPRFPEFRILNYVRTTRKDSRNWWARCPSCAAAGSDRTGDNLAIQIKDPRFYKCWAGCTKEEIRAALGQPIRERATV